MVLEDNVSQKNCLSTTGNVGDVNLQGPGGVGPVSITNHSHTGIGRNECYAGMSIQGFNDVCVNGGTIKGGSDFGIRAHLDRNLDVRSIQVDNAAQTPAKQIGMCVQDTAQFLNYTIGLDRVVQWNNQHYCESDTCFDDEDSVAFCDLENSPPTPQGCQNLPSPISLACDEVQWEPGVPTCTCPQSPCPSPPCCMGMEEITEDLGVQSCMDGGTLFKCEPSSGETVHTVTNSCGACGGQQCGHPSPWSTVNVCQ